MVEETLLTTTLREVVKTGKYTVGAKNVLKSIKGSQLLIYSTRFKTPLIDKILETSASLSIPTLGYAGTSFDLGHVCGKPFRISIMIIKSPGEGNITPLLNHVKE